MPFTHQVNEQKRVKLNGANQNVPRTETFAICMLVAVLKGKRAARSERRAWNMWRELFLLLVVVLPLNRSSEEEEKVTGSAITGGGE